MSNFKIVFSNRTQRTSVHALSCSRANRPTSIAESIWTVEASDAKAAGQQVHEFCDHEARGFAKPKICPCCKTEN